MITKVFASSVALSLLIFGSASAAVIQVDLSPLPGLALNSTNYSLGDHALGLAAPNAVGQPASLATGNEVGAGITFDDVTKVLSWDIGYGSDFGFIDLAGDWTNAHIHGPIAVQFPLPNTGTGVRVPITPNIPGSSLRTGRFTGSAVLSPDDQVSLFDNLLYVNVHSQFAAGGEIRGQLVPVVPEPTTTLLLALGSVVLISLRRRR